ncbi:hypothetical protein [Thalassotalea fusca]
MEEQKYPSRTSKFYWALGGDVFWYNFRMSFLKKVLLFNIGFYVTVNLVRSIAGEFAVSILGGAFLLLILTIIVLIHTNPKIAKSSLRDKSTARDARGVLMFIAALCLLMLCLLPFGYVSVAK